MHRQNINDILKKYSSKIETSMNSSNFEKTNYSQAYSKFKAEMSPTLTRYEKLCNTIGSIIKLKVSEKEESKIRQFFNITHLDIEPWKALTLSIVTFLLVFFLGLFISLGVSLIRGGFSNFPFLFFCLITLLAVFLFYFVQSYPERLANSWRLKASSQMVPAILYIVIYMRHTSNLEKAIAFASEHLPYPLALDFKKVFYNLEIGKFSTIKESLDNYLEIWRDYSIEFIESFHLIESSLFEPSEERRIASLEKALQVVLDGVYEKMLRFTHDVKSPLTNVYMLGVVLPTLGLGLLPLASAMIGEFLKWYHIVILFNLIIPFFVFYLVNKALMMRPGGYGETELLERNPLYPEYISKTPYIKAFLICLPLFLIGILPLVFQFTPIPELLGLQKDYSFSEIGLTFMGEEKIFGFFDSGNGSVGPFGVGALIMSFFLPLSISFFFALSYNDKTKNLILERDKTKQLEFEFNNSLFQLGNRIGNGIPPEIAFGKLVESSRGLKTEDFFRRVNYNIQQMGMSVDAAIFDPKRGALGFFPSDLIATSMRVLVESAKKGLKIAALSLMSISEYVRNIQKITERLRDLLAEVVSDMRSNMTFIAPLLSGVLIGLAAMISSILGRLKLSELTNTDVSGLGGLDSMLSIFEVTKMIPPYYLQISIGFYLIEVIFILTMALVVIDSGEDSLEKTNKIGKNLKTGILIYIVTALVSVLALFLLASIVLSGIF